MGPDFRVLVRKGQKKAQQYYLQYGVRCCLGGFSSRSVQCVSSPTHTHAAALLQESIPVLELVREIAAVMQEFTQSGGVRPFGVSLLIAGVDDDGPQLFQVDPSGAYFGWRASAIGKNFTNAKTFLEKASDATPRVRMRATQYACSHARYPVCLLMTATEHSNRHRYRSATRRTWSWRTRSTRRC